MRARRHIMLTTLFAPLAVLLVTCPVATAATDEEIEQAIVDGLAWLAAQQNPNGSWEEGCEVVAHTGLACLKFEDRARELGFDDPTDPAYEYSGVVSGALAYITSQSINADISAEPAADADGDDIGTYFNSCPGNHDTYNSGIAMMAIAASQRPDLYGGLLQDAVDWMSFAQNNSTCGIHRGGWRYNANPCSTSDNSTSGYATLGLGYAIATPPFGFGLAVPQFVIDELDTWIDAIQGADGGSYYTPDGGSGNVLRTGNLLYEIGLVGETAQSQRALDAIDFLEGHWYEVSCDGWWNHRQATFTMMKGLEALGVDLIDLDNDGIPEHDWFDEVSTRLIDTQMADGRWPDDCWAGEILSTAWALLTLEKVVPPLPPAGRVDVSKKGSLLVFPKIEIKWNAAGDVVQDTFLDLTNDYPEDVFVHWYFINGDPPLEAVSVGDPPVLVEPAHDGWNWVNCITRLTNDEPTYMSAVTGLPDGCQPFTILDDGGRPDPEGPPGSRVLRGYAIAYAVDNFGNEIRWNHLKGDAVLINYAGSTAWEYSAYAFQASAAEHGQATDETPGQLLLDGSEYDICFDKLLLDFYAVGSQALSGDAVVVSVDTDLTLFPVDLDVRQDANPPVITKAHFDIWNMEERMFSGTTRCITLWDQTMLSVYDPPNHFLLRNLQTDKGKARIDGLASAGCGPYSVDAALLGVAAKMLAFSGAGSGLSIGGTTLVGQGEQPATILFDVIEPPGELKVPDRAQSSMSPARFSGGHKR